MDFRILGPLEVVRADGSAIPLPSGKGRVLLGVLLVNAETVVSTDHLIDDLWGDSVPATAPTALQGLVSRLRRQLEPAPVAAGTSRIIETRTPGYVLSAQPQQIDSKRFRAVVRQAADQRPQVRADSLRRALESWRGPALADFTYEPFAQSEIASLEELRRVAIEERIEADLILGRHQELVAELELLVSEYPLRERLWGQLMVARYRCGRQSEALGAYRELRHKMIEELGIEPGPELQSLELAILRQDPTLDPPSRHTDDHPPDTLQPWLPTGRKTVTVVFAEMTPESPNAQDPEARRLLIRRGHELVSDALIRHGGTVEGLIGDVVVAVFGLPSARENDATRAVRASLDIQESMGGLNDDLTTEGARLDVRIGINTGEVIVGGSEDASSVASGAAVGVASRLQQAARDGEVLVGETTQRLVKKTFRVEEREIADSTIRAFTVIETALAVSPGDDAETEMVGRDDELQELTTLFEASIGAGKARFLSVVGEAGIGKSRLIREFAATVSRDARVLTGHCPPYGDGITFWPLREVVLAATGGVGREAIAHRLAQSVEPDDARAMAAEIAEAIGLNEESEVGGRLFGAVQRFFESVAETRPLVVVLEDLHWAQPMLVELTDHLVSAIQAPVVIVGSFRTEHVDLFDRWERLRREGATISLGPLSAAASEQLIADMTVDVPEQTRTRIADIGQGNPLFLEQLSVVVEETSDVPDLDLALPASLQAVLVARIDRLGPAERDLLRCASVAGRSFTVDTLAELVPAKVRPALGRHLAALQEKSLIRRDVVDDQDLTFRHVLIQHEAYRSIPRETRAELHLRLAESLDRQRPSGEGGFDELVGYHLEQAYNNRGRLGVDDTEIGRLAQAAGERLARAGARANRRYDAEAAANLFARARALLDDDHPEMSEVLRQLAEVYQVLGRNRAGQEVLDDRLRLATGDLERDAIRLESAKISLAIGPDPISLEAVERQAVRSLKAYAEIGDQAGMARACLVLAQLCERGGRMVEMEQVAQRGLVHADLSDESREQLAHRWLLALAVARGPTPVRMGISLCEDLSRWQGREHPGVLAEVSVLWAMVGDIERGRATMARAKNLMAAALRVRRPLMFAAVLTGEMETMAGDLVAAEEAYRTAIRLATEFGERDVIARAEAALSLVLVERDEVAEAATMAAGSREHAPAKGVGQALWRVASAAVASARGDERAPQLAQVAVELVPEEMLSLAADVRLVLAGALDAAGNHASASDVRDDALARYERKGNMAGARRARGDHAALATGAVRSPGA